MLDSVVDQYKFYTGANSPLGAASKARVTEHLERIREYEQRAYAMNRRDPNAPDQPQHSKQIVPGGEFIWAGCEVFQPTEVKPLFDKLYAAINSSGITEHTIDLCFSHGAIKDAYRGIMTSVSSLQGNFEEAISYVIEAMLQSHSATIVHVCVICRIDLVE